jgi:hypothetical protein
MLHHTWKAAGIDLELHLADSDPGAVGSCQSLAGEVRGAAVGQLVPGGSVLVLARATGLAEEVFLDPGGKFTLCLELAPASENSFLLTVYDTHGRELAGAALIIQQTAMGCDGENCSAPTRATLALEPAWPQLARRVKECLFLVGKLADLSGRPPQELFEQVYAQERYAEKAHETGDQTHYRECFDNLGELARYLEQLCRAYLPP